MIQAAFIVNREHELILDERTGCRPVGEEELKIVSILSRIITGESPYVGHADLDELFASYTTEDGFFFCLLSDTYDDRIAVERTLISVWSEVLPCLRKGDMCDARTKITQQITEQFIKISIFGLPAVGKTTLVRLILGKILPIVYRPTIGVEVSLVPEGIFGHHQGLVIWDLPGQSKFRTIWPAYLKGSHLVLIVTDSQLESVLWSRRMLSNVRVWAPRAQLLGIANKQDLGRALLAERVEKILDIPTIGLVALDPDRKQKHSFLTRVCELLGIKPIPCIN